MERNGVMSAFHYCLKPLLVVFCLVAMATLAGCDLSSSPQGDGDTDTELADITEDIDTAEAEADVVAEQEPELDPELDAEEAEIMDPDGDEEIEEEPDPELDLDPEVEEEETEWEETPLEPGVIAVDELPWPGLQVTICNETMNTDASLAQSRAVWGDDKGIVYFGGDAFWVLDETGETGMLTCDAAMPHAMYSMDGRVTATGNELWTGHEGKIGHLTGGEWAFIELPESMLAEGGGAADQVVDIDIAGDYVSVLTNAKLGLYDVANDSWRVVEEPEALNRDYGLAYDGQTLWASAGVVLYSVDLQSAVFHEEVTVVDEPADGETVGITGADDDGVWMVTVYNSVQIFSSPNFVHRYKDYSIELLSLETDRAQAGLIGYPKPYPSLSVSAGMNGYPLLHFKYLISRELPSHPCGQYVHLLVQLIATDAATMTASAHSSTVGLCTTCYPEPINNNCFDTYPITDQDFWKARSWRGQNRMWIVGHSSDNLTHPRRYTW